MIRIQRTLFAALALVLGTALPGAQHDMAEREAPRRTQPWSQEILDLAARLPIQDGGRVKPLSTFAGFTLLRINGKRKVETPQGELLKPTEWLLDVFFFPRASVSYECFHIRNPEIPAAMGLRIPGKKAADRYSLEELEPGLDRLADLAQEYAHIEDKQRTSLQQQIVVLQSNINLFLALATQMDFARWVGPVNSPEIQEIFHGETTVNFREILDHAAELQTLFRRTGGDRESVAFPYVALGENLARTGGSVAMLPPLEGAGERLDWIAPGELFYDAYSGLAVDERHRAAVDHLSAMAAARSDQATFRTELEGLLAVTSGLAEARGEYEKIGLEVSYYRFKPITWAVFAFGLAFVLAAFLWLAPRSRVLYSGALAMVGSGTLLLAVAITLRCIIRSRPPVSTLYETLLFVTATGTATALIVEWINHRRIAVSCAAVLGLVGVLLVNGYETLDKQDTMPSLVAVLDTNFWLATHVTAITLGYSAGIFAAVVASMYLLVKLIGGANVPRAFYSVAGRIVYGVLCFAVIFSTVGTILGGIWANDSWGRFWGWDPKENGALLIVLSQLAILHARMGGYLREHGVCMAAAFAGTIVAFSWFGTNLLGVGLHSYGFTEGINNALWTYYGVQWGIVGLGGLALFLERRRLQAR